MVLRDLVDIVDINRGDVAFYYIIGHDATKNVQVHGIGLDIDCAPGCTKVVLLLALDEVDISVLARNQNRGLIIVHDHAVTGLGVRLSHAAGKIGKLHGLRSNIRVQFVGNLLEYRLIRLDCAGIEPIRAIFNRLGTLSLPLSLRREYGYIRDAANTLFVEDISPNIIIPQTQCSNVDSVLHTRAQFNALVAFVPLVDGVCGRRIHGRLIDKPDGLFEFAV